MSHFGKWFGGHHGSRKHDGHGRDDAAHRQERAAVLCPGCRQANDAARAFASIAERACCRAVADNADRKRPPRRNSAPPAARV